MLEWLDLVPYGIINPWIQLGLWLLDREALRTFLLLCLGSFTIGLALMHFSKRDWAASALLGAIGLGFFSQASMGSSSPVVGLTLYIISIILLFSYPLLRIHSRRKAQTLLLESPTGNLNGHRTSVGAESPSSLIVDNRRVAYGTVAHRLIAGMVFFFAASIQLYRLDKVPPGVGNYMASGAATTMTALQGGWPKNMWKLTPGTMLHTAQSPVYFLTQYASFRLVGPNLYGARFNDGIWMMIGLCVFYLLLKRLWGFQFALMGVATLSCCRFYIAFNRTGTYLSATIAWSIMLLFCLHSIIRKPGVVKFGLTGAALVIADYLYAPIRLMVLSMVAGLLVYSVVLPQKRRMKLIGFIVMSITMMLGLALQVSSVKNFNKIYFFERPGSPPDTPIWKKTADGLKISTDFSAVATLSNLARNLRKTFELFCVQGAVGELFTVFLLPGLILLITNRRIEVLSIGIWGLLAFLPAILINPEPRRFILALPIFAVCVTIGLVYILTRIKAIVMKDAIRRSLQGAIILLCLPFFLMDFAAFHTRFREVVHRDWAYGHSERDRLGWLAREIIPYTPVVFSEVGINRRVLDFLVFEPSRYLSAKPGHYFLTNATFLELLRKGVKDAIYAILGDANWKLTPEGYPAGSLLEQSIRIAQEQWPTARIIEGPWRAAPTKIAFSLIVPPGAALPPIDHDSERWQPIRIKSICEFSH